MNNTHTHCVICSRPFEYNNKHKTVKCYICSDCMNTFPMDYIKFRLECYEKGLHSRDFDILEQRLTFGCTKPVNYSSLPNSCYMVVNYDKDEEDDIF